MNQELDANPTAPGPVTAPGDLGIDDQTGRGWWLDRAREPSTYQGLTMIAGVFGAFLFHDSLMGEHILQGALALAGLIGVGKREAVGGRDF